MGGTAHPCLYCRLRARSALTGSRTSLPVRRPMADGYLPSVVPARSVSPRAVLRNCARRSRMSLPVRGSPRSLVSRWARSALPIASDILPAPAQASARNMSASTSFPCSLTCSSNHRIASSGRPRLKRCRPNGSPCLTEVRAGRAVVRAGARALGAHTDLLEVRAGGENGAGDGDEDREELRSAGSRHVSILSGQHGGLLIEGRHRERRGQRLVLEAAAQGLAERDQAGRDRGVVHRELVLEIRQGALGIEHGLEVR